MIVRYCLGTIAVLVLFFSFAVQSQASDYTFYIAGIRPGSIEADGGKVSLDGSPLFGFRLGSNFVPFFGMEHTLAFSPDFLHPQNVDGISDSNGFVYNSNLVITLPAIRLEPYLTAGIGLVHQYGSSDLPVGTKPAFNYGGGVKFPCMKGPFGLRFDIRGYRAGFVTDTVNMLEMSGGLMISTGR